MKKIHLKKSLILSGLRGALGKKITEQIDYDLQDYLPRSEFKAQAALIRKTERDHKIIQMY